jgi:ferredoxin-NADP reductase
LPRETQTARLVQKACISESAQCYHLEFAIDGVADFPYPPGQFISTVANDPRGKSQTRAYSIASAAQGNRFELCVNRVEGGFFSNHLCDLPEGGAVQVHGPHGNFTLREPLTDSIFVATGTGIAPMRAFTQWLFPESGERAGEDRSEGKHFWLVYGTRHESELYYRDYFERIANEHSNFHYITTLSRPGEEWLGHRGYVQEFLAPIVETRSAAQSSSAAQTGAVNAALVDTVVAVEEQVLSEQISGLPQAFDIHTYICGLNNMVSAVRERLTAFGWHKKQIIFERYD